MDPASPYGASQPGQRGQQVAASGMEVIGSGGVTVPPSHPIYAIIQAQQEALVQASMAQASVGRAAMSQASTATVGNPAHPQQQDAMVDEIGKMAEEDVQETVSTEVFSSYHYREVLPGCLPHPGDVVEAGMLASISMPKPMYPLSDSLPDEMITGGKLSCLQLEGIIHACERHQRLLPNGSRAGFFIGDAAGVGKGRQIAGIIFDNFTRGRRKHVWFSISTDLVVDARRDLSDIGCYIKVIEGCQQLDKETRVFGLPADFKEGVIFSTYATLVSSVQKGRSLGAGKQSRLQQLVDWCGGVQFDGCLIFDECHKAKNFVPGRDSASTKVALAVTHIQRLLPKARVLYCSATGVTDVKNMAFMERMGLWGDGAPFKSFDQFIETVQKKGLGVAEMLAMEMKGSGMYVSRGLSYRQAEFSTVEIKLTKEQIKMYDTAAHVWNELRVALENAMSRTHCSNTRVWSAFWSCHQRFFKQLCLGIKVPAVVKEAKAALEDGQCVVIGLQTTGEASMESEALSSKGQIKGFISLCREILTRFIQQHFPTNIEGQLLAGESPEDEWSATAKKMLLSFAKQIALPDSTLDEMIDQLGGPDEVAEMTGRRGRIVRRGRDEIPRYENRGAADSGAFLESLNVQERNQFMNGPKRVAIISDAASTGISLHADKRVTNQCRRVHMTIELPWSADKAVQQLGRSHRSNQSSGPLYKLMTTNLGGERRFAATVARRLQSLGALTKGDRRAATGADLGEFNFDTPYGRQALRTMYSAICKQELVSGVSLSSVTQGRFSSFTEFNDEVLECLNLMCILEMDVLRNQPKVKDAVVNDVGRFLNRILGLSVSKQQLVFNYFVRCLDAQIQYAKKEGKYNEGLVDVQASSVELAAEPRTVFKDTSNGHNPTQHVVLNVDRGLSWDAALQRLSTHQGPDAGFYLSKRDMYGKRLLVLATRKEKSAHAFTLARPNTGVSNFDEDEGDLFGRYRHISESKAEERWKQQYEEAKDRCVHGPACKSGAACTVGSRCYRMHLLCGGIVTLMSLLETTMNRYGPRLQLTKAERSLRVVRAQLDGGERVVGIRYPELLIPLVEQALQEQKMAEMTQKQQTTLLTQGMLGMAASSTPVSPTATSGQVEPVTAVQVRCLKKALTPPVTLRNFFKVIAKDDEENDASQSNQSVPEEGSTVAKATDGSVRSHQERAAEGDLEMGEKGKGPTSRARTSKGPVKGGIGAKGARKSKEKLNFGTVKSDHDISSESGDEFTPEEGTLRNGTTGTSNSTAPAAQDDVMGGGGRRGTKRENPPSPSESGSKDIKRSRSIEAATSCYWEEKPKSSKKVKSGKQATLMSAFSKVEERKTKSCPICGKQFKPTSLNKEINEHIDNCLIE